MFTIGNVRHLLRNHQSTNLNSVMILLSCLVVFMPKTKVLKIISSKRSFRSLLTSSKSDRDTEDSKKFHYQPRNNQAVYPLAQYQPPYQPYRFLYCQTWLSFSRRSKTIADISEKIFFQTTHQRVQGLSSIEEAVLCRRLSLSGNVTRLVKCQSAQTISSFVLAKPCESMKG